MGTLVFHILLFSTFLLADVDMKKEMKEEEIVIEFPDMISEPEELPQEEQQEEQAKNNMQASQNNRSNFASNRSAKENTTKSADDFFDESYLKELEAARQLASDVKNQLSKEVVDLSDIEMPEETTEGMDPDSIKNVIYAGESNIVYYLENRYHVSLPVPVYLAQGGGTVIVDIWVNRAGKVVEATSRNHPNKELMAYAREAASRTRFNRESSAPSKQKGTIHYTFVAQ